MKKIRTICFDIDNTICLTKKNFYLKSKPIKKNIKFSLINNLYESGHYIKIFTARYMGTYKENINLIKKKYFNKTEKQLKSWGLKYHKLYMGKPSFDIYVDDKCLNFSQNWLKQLKRKLNFK